MEQTVVREERVDLAQSEELEELVARVERLQ